MGLTEPEAYEKYGEDVKICASDNLSQITISHFISFPDKSSFRALYFSQVAESHKEPTVYKLIVVGEEERVVGVHIIGLGSDEALQGFAVAIKMGGTSKPLTGYSR